jgi:DNA repair exonuclease SbcCD nuclease subunit
MIRLIHTGDVHLGAPFPLLGEFGRSVRAQVRTTFARVLALARDRGAAAVLVAGDLFDRHRPDVADVRFVLEEIRKLRPLPVVLLPGTHDLLSPDSLYRSLPDPPDNCLLIDQDAPQTIFLEAVGLAIHARANRAKRGGDPPLARLRPDPRYQHNVAMAHASVERGDIGADPDHDYVISEADVRAAGMQYLALGHWHKCAEQFPGLPCVTWYSGSPEPLQFDTGDASGYALEVVLGDGRPQVIPHKIGTYRWQDVSLDASSVQHLQDVRRALEGLADPQAILRVRLQGALPSTAAFDSETLRDDLAGRFAHLLLDVAGVRTRWEDFDPETVFPPGTIGAAFIALAQERLRGAGEADRALWEEVLRRGTALLAKQEDVG